MIVHRARGCCRSPAADPRRLGRGRRRPDRRVGRAPAPPAPDGAASRRSRRVRDPARPRQRAHPSRALLAARPGAAGRVDVDAWVAALIALRRAACRIPTQPNRRRRRRASREARAAGTALVGDISNTLVDRSHRCATAACRRRVPRAARVQRDRSGTRSRGGRAARIDALDAGRAGVRVEPRAARAVLGVAGAVQAIARRAARTRVRQRPPRRVARGSRVPARRQRAVARAARGARRVEPGVDAARLRARSSTSTTFGLLNDAAAGRPRRAAHRRGAGAAGGGRRDARHLSAQQPLDGRRQRRRSSGSTRPACASRSAPTAWRASTT